MTVIACALSAQAQHFNAWTRLTISVPVADRWRVDAELQHRRQNGLGDRDMLYAPLMYTFRSWVHYQWRDNVKCSVSPFAYFSNYRIIQSTPDEVATPTREIRGTVAIEIKRPIYKKTTLVLRSAAEYRHWLGGQPDVVRLRNRVGVNYQLSRNMDATVYEELLCNLSGVPPGHLFDHNRAALTIGYKLSTALRLDAGYIYINRLLAAPSTDVVTEHNIFVNLTYRFERK